MSEERSKRLKEIQDQVMKIQAHTGASYAIMVRDVEGAFLLDLIDEMEEALEGITTLYKKIKGVANEGFSDLDDSPEYSKAISVLASLSGKNE